MTWSNFVANGGGPIHLRLVFEGCPDQWVSHRSLAGAVGDGRTRRYGLVPADVDIVEKLIMQDASLELGGMTLSIEEREDEACTYAFIRTPRVLCWLAEDVGTTDPEVITVDNTSRVTASTYVYAGTETWFVNSKTSTTITVARAKWQSHIQEHYHVVGAEAKTVPVTDAPSAFAGRRAYLYAHGPTELSPTAAGTLIWRGVVAREPTLIDLVRWQISLDPITALLSQVVAGDTDRPTNITGAYYPWTMPFRWALTEFTTAGSQTVSQETGPQILTGFFATPPELVAALNVQLAALVTSPTYKNSYYWEHDESGHPVLVAMTPASDERYFAVIGGSRIDGKFGTVTSSPPAGTINYYYNVWSVQPSSTYRVTLIDDGAMVRRGWPRGWFGTYKVPSIDQPSQDDADVAAWPATRVYLADTLGATADDALIAELFLRQSEARGRMLEIAAIGETATLNDVRFELPVFFASDALDGSTEFRLARKYATNADLRTFKDALLTEAVKKNRGSTPWLTTDDVAGWADAEDAAEDLGIFAGLRDYIFAKPIPLADVLKEEFKLVGCCPTIDSIGRIDCFRLRAPANTEASVLELTDDIILSGSWPQWTREKGGIVNEVIVKQGYDALEDEHRGTLHVVRDVTSISEHGFTRDQTIAPYSEGRNEIRYNNAQEIARGPLGFFNKFHVLDVGVNWKAWNARLGDTVSISSTKLPNPTTGTRGIEGLTATVIGREWRIPGFGRLTLLLHARHIRGYAPAAKLTVQTLGGTVLQRTITVEQTYFAATGTNDTSFFAPGDHVSLQRMDGTYTQRLAVVDAVTPTTMTLTFTSTAGITVTSGQIWVIQFRDRADTYTPSDNQARYAWIADDNNLLYDGSDAGEFAP